MDGGVPFLNLNPVSCPLPKSPDYDLGGSGPNLRGNEVGFGQKSGIYWDLRADTGDVIWSSVVGPGSTLGGMEWGTATDGNRIYAAIANGDNKPYPLINGTTINWGAWSALDGATGKILWQTADPDQALAPWGRSRWRTALCSRRRRYEQYASLATLQTGRFCGRSPAADSVLDGPSVVDGTVYWGSGYANISGTPNNKVIGFWAYNRAYSRECVRRPSHGERQGRVERRRGVD